MSECCGSALATAKKHISQSNPVTKLRLRHPHATSTINNMATNERDENKNHNINSYEHEHTHTDHLSSHLHSTHAKTFRQSDKCIHNMMQINLIIHLKFQFQQGKC